ncbi:MAG: hypothetical protein Q4D02_03260 [Clostridia bacterium]|nr:hypothetical protein [Clostridia bacterium]
MDNHSDNQEMINKINNLEKEIRKNKVRNNIIILMIVLIIIILFVICLLGYKIGKIGYTIPTFGEVQEEIDTITITDENGTTWKNSDLQIFKNAKFNGENIIAPHSIGTYQFYVKNKVGKDITYNIRLLDEMSHFVNMKYKLKIDNVYICGDESTYVSIDELNVDDVVLMTDSTTLYTLEWYWEDNDELDTYVGSLKTDEYYTLRLNIQAFDKFSN